MKKVLVIIISVLVIFLGWAYLKNGYTNVVPLPETEYGIDDFYLTKQNLVLIGGGLSEVRVYGVPVDPTKEDYVLGSMDIVEESEESQTWLLPIPEEQLIKEIYAIGHVSSREHTKKYYFPIAGVSNIHESLWVKIPEKTLTLSVGEFGELKDSKFLFNKVLEDSRCPLEVECVQAGRLVIELLVNNISYVISSADEDVKVSDYYVNIAAIYPDMNHEGISPNEYEVTLLIISEME